MPTQQAGLADDAQPGEDLVRAPADAESASLVHEDMSGGHSPPLAQGLASKPGPTV